ncbi:FecR family protein [Rhodoferax ferrireducens]|uniref:FecR family protein n=1 Tax=Rhodoferax ferrireducens TaxID=192843 RepID=UPI000E0D4D10|nr:FecR family protein [Rhodoferax ferrireducens]
MSNNALWRNILATAGSFFFLLGAAHGEDAGKVVQAIGDVRLGGAPAKVGDTVQAGDALTTGGDGYLYIKTVDGGFLILRPGSDARVLAYHIDPAQPANNRIKIELRQGVARSISGEAVKKSRQNFRFNTPVAAIGVRGTDFTVFTDEQTTRVAVVSGGVVVSGFGAACGADGSGPCEGSAKRELFAGQEAQVLQVNRGQAVPQLLRSNALSPDVNAPPRADEPPKTTTSSNGAAAPGANTANSNTDPNLAPLKLSSLDKQLLPTPTPVTVPVTVPEVTPAPAPRVPAIVWGRWQALLDKPADINLTALRADNQLIGVNTYYALLRNKDSLWQSPAEGAVSFSLQNSQAVVQANGTGPISAASLENGKLTVNFATSSFTTQFDLLTQGQRIARQAEGTVFKDGTFGNTSQFLGRNNMLVQGVLAQNPGPTAAYLFESRLDNGQPNAPLSGQVASGVTYWAK